MARTIGTLPSTVDVRNQDVLGVGQYLGEVIQQRVGAPVLMGLKRHEQATAREALTRRAQDSADLRGMVRIVANNGAATSAVPQLEPPLDTAKLRHPAAGPDRIGADDARQRERKQGVVHVESTGDLELDARQPLSIDDRFEGESSTIVSGVDGANVGEQPEAHPEQPNVRVPSVDDLGRNIFVHQQRAAGSDARRKTRHTRRAARGGLGSNRSGRGRR